MCGILGINRTVPPAQFLVALNKIAHRGPDSHGWLSEGGVTLGHHRLAILDLSEHGAQPMTSVDGRLTIVFNGEIYNHLEVRSEIGEGVQYKSSTDTETILYGYLKYGKDIVRRLNGIFSFAIWDRRQGELFLARDPLGVKPLYYFHSGELLAFSSEIKALLELPGVERDLNLTSLVDYIHFLWSPGTGTPFSKIRKLPPGHCLTLKLAAPETAAVSRYYELPFDGRYDDRNETDLVDELATLLGNAVERQLLSDVPVGFFLSGGLDSSLIAAIAKQRLGRSFNCYTIRSQGDTSADGFVDDLKFARRIAGQLGCPLVEVDAEIDIIRDFDRMIWHLDEPQADAAPLNVLNICTRARANGDIVLLGGVGGDDLFSGYRRHQVLQFEPLFMRTPRFVAKALAGAVSALPSSQPRLRRLKKLMAGIADDPMQRLFGYFEWIDLCETKLLFSDSVRSVVQQHDPSVHLSAGLANISDEKSPLNRMLYCDLKYFLADHNLNYTDKLSMAVGVEVRVPFLDLDLVAFSCRVPPWLKMRGRQTKYLLKKVAERYLPNDVIHRSKTGFGAPVRTWMLSGLMDPLLDCYLNDERVRQRGLFDCQRTRSLIERTKSGAIDASYTLWSLLAIESWMTQFIPDNRFPIFDRQCPLREGKSVHRGAVGMQRLALAV